MLARLNHPAAKQHVCITDATAPRGDPTGTGPIRARYKSLVSMRWRKFAAELREVIHANVLVLPQRNRLAAPQYSMAGVPNAEVLRAFQRWVDAGLARLILDNEAYYLRPLVSAAYMRGAARATRLANQDAVPDAVLKEVDNKVKAFHQFQIMELQGIMEAVSQQLVRAASEAVINKRSITETVRRMSAVIRKIGRLRTDMLIDMLGVKVNGSATLDVFQAFSINRVGLIPETYRRRATVDAFQDARKKRAVIRPKKKRKRKKREDLVEVLTAGDNDVCEECEDISESGPYTISRARTLIPAHPNCRCAFVPWGDDRFSSEDL